VPPYGSYGNMIVGHTAYGIITRTAICHDSRLERGSDHSRDVSGYPSGRPTFDSPHLHYEILVTVSSQPMKLLAGTTSRVRLNSSRPANPKAATPQAVRQTLNSQDGRWACWELGGCGLGFDLATVLRRPPLPASRYNRWIKPPDTSTVP